MYNQFTKICIINYHLKEKKRFYQSFKSVAKAYKLECEPPEISAVFSTERRQKKIALRFFKKKEQADGERNEKKMR